MAPTAHGQVRAVQRAGRLWLFLSRTRTLLGSLRFLRFLGLLWPAGIGALLFYLLDGGFLRLSLADLSGIVQAGLWPLPRAFGLGMLVFLVVAGLLAGITVVGFALLPDLQTERGWPFIVVVLGLESVVALVASFYLTGLIYLWLWP